MQKETHEAPVTEEVKKRRRLLVWLGRILLSIVLFILLLVGVVHIPFVQQWGIKKLTTSMSETLNTKVTIGRFTLNPISDLTLKEIFIGSPEHPGDTLIYAEKLNVDYKRIWDVFSKRITINQIGFENGLLNIHRIAGDSMTNLDLMLFRLMPEANPDAPPFVLDLKTLHAKSLEVRVDDETNGMFMNIFFGRADVELDTLDIPGKFVDIADLDLDEPVIKVINRVPMGELTAPTVVTSKPWYIDVDHLRMADGIFMVDNQTKAPVTSLNGKGIDFAHMVLEGVNIEMDSVVSRGSAFKAIAIDIQARHTNGFEINTLSADRASITDNGIILDALHIKTPDSEISNSFSMLYSGYADFSTFVDSVRFDIPAADIRLRTADLLAIIPALQEVSFFNENADKDLILQGKVTGHVNRLRIKNMIAGLGDISLEGDFRSRDIAIAGSQLISLDLQRSAFSAASLKSLFPKMDIPPILNKLGKISFAGNIDGYPDDFVAFGTFNTALGKITLDMNLDVVKGMKDGNYSGTVALQDFDLGTFTGNKDLGRITMSGRVIEGIGLTSSSLYADVTAQLSSLNYKGYHYRNARIDGQMAGKLFSGTMDINDPNMDMHFEGVVDMREGRPRLDFISRVDSVNLWELGFSKERISIQGIFDVDLLVGKFSDISGMLDGEKVVLTVKDIDYTLDSLQFRTSSDSATGDRKYTIVSDIVSAEIIGEFDPTLLAGHVKEYLYDYYPRAFDPPTKSVKPLVTQRLSWNVTIHDSKHWFDIAGVESLRLERANLTGKLDLQTQQSSGIISLPAVHYKNMNGYGITVAFVENEGLTNIDLELIAADINEGIFFEDVFITGTATDDSVKVNFKTDQLADIIDDLDLDIEAKSVDGNWGISFNPNKLGMLGDDWEIPAGNKVEIRKGSFVLENFELIATNKKIIIDDIDEKGLEAYITGFDISYLNELWINDKFEFYGEYTLDAEIDNIYDIKQMEVALNLPELMINNVPYGQMVLNAFMNNPKDSVKINLSLSNNETSLIGQGAYLPPIKSIQEAEQNFLRMDLVATEFPLDFLEFLLGGNIRDTEGSVDMNLSLTGKVNALNPSGTGKVYNGSTTIDYLGAAYSFHEQSFSITEDMIDLSGITLYDVLGNTAVVQGGISHRYLRDLGFNASMNSPRILGLDVTSDENNVFYGKGIGSVNATFSGSVANPRMVINTTTAKGTHIFIPLSAGRNETDRDFAIFLENGRLPVVQSTLINVGGMDMTLIMTITEDAIVEIIFDDNTGEVLRAQGNGNLTLATDRLGNFTMRGDYTIAQGDYLFTNFRVVRKPFELVPGGTIRWEGDPYDAQLNVEAKYKGLTAPVYNLISEYITDPTGAQSNVYQQSRERTNIDLLMRLSGSLLHPDIGFDIDFPDLTGELKGYTNTKMNTLKANDVAMFQQVVGLLITRSFLPTTSGTSSGSLLTEGIDNTFSELIASTLSGYLGGLLGNIIPTGEVLSGIDFQMNLDLPISQGAGSDQLNPLEDPDATVVEFSLPLEFFNDRLEVIVGTDYVTGATTVARSEYWAGDVTFLYKLTPDGRLRVRAYNQNTVTVEGRKNKVGLGLSYRREYDSLGDMFGKKEKEK